MKKILALGYIPKWRGGRQLTGLATGIFDLHNAVNGLDSEYKVVIAATDIYEKIKKIENTDVIGWNKKILVSHIIIRFYRMLFFGLQSWKMHKKYPAIPFWDTLFKIIFFDYAIEKERPDIIHLHGAVYALFINALWRNRKPVVLRLHGINGFDNTIEHYDIYRNIEKDIISLPFSFVTFVTSHVCSEWKKKYGEFKCPMIPLINGFNSDIFYVPTYPVEKEYDLITIAGVTERKGQGRVMEAMKKLRDENGTILSYIIVGNGDRDYETKIKKYAKENALVVKFVDYCPQTELNKLLWKSKFFIQPSASEGFGKTYIEAAASGIPSILPEFLPIAKEPGVLSELNAVFTKNESSDSIYELLRSLDFKKEINPNKVSESVSWLSWKSLAQKYIALYNHYSSNE